jgi:lipopolysaccharide transport protein LptA
MIRTCIFATFPLLLCLTALAAPPGISKHDAVTVRADEAWEDPKLEAVHFRGNFEIQASDWAVTAREATLYGPLDDPDRVVAEGGARIRLNTQAQSTRKPVSGEADRIEYRRDGDHVTLIGNARLHKRDNTMRAATIEYDRATDSFRAGGKGGGVQIMFTPQEKSDANR